MVNSDSDDLPLPEWGVRGDTVSLANSPEHVEILANTDTEGTKGPLDFFRSVDLYFDPRPDTEHIEIQIRAVDWTNSNSRIEFVSLRLDRINGRLIAQAVIPESLKPPIQAEEKDKPTDSEVSLCFDLV